MLDFIVTLIIGLIAGFIGTNTGGGGFISIPALIFLGLPAQIAVATNRLASLGLSVSGFYRFNRHKKVDFKVGLPSFLLVGIGSLIGANTLLLIPNDLLEKIVAVLMLIILVFIVKNKDFGTVKRESSKNPLVRLAGYASFFIVGFWGAFFGGGFAVFSRFALTILFGLTFLESSTITNMLNIGMSLIAIAVFISSDVINWAFAIPLLIGMVLGAYIGASYSIKKGDVWLRSLFIVVVVISALKLLIS